MKEDRPDLKTLLEMQLSAVPIINQAVRESFVSSDRIRLAIPFRRRWWTRFLKGPFRLSTEKKLELDPIGTEVFGMFDGERTLEQIIDAFRERRMLSFFEARAVILEFVRRLMRYNLILFKIRDSNAQSSADETTAAPPRN